MMQRIITVAIFASLLQITFPTLANGKGIYDEYGFDKLPDAVEWISKLDAAWESIVTKEERAQLLRRIEQIASDTAEIEIKALNAQAVLRKETISNDELLDKELSELTRAVRVLRESMIQLSTQLGKQTGQEGLDIAQHFGRLAVARGEYISSAHSRLKYRIADFSTAADELGEAAKIAAKARSELVLFINLHNPRKAEAGDIPSE